MSSREEISGEAMVMATNGEAMVATETSGADTEATEATDGEDTEDGDVAEEDLTNAEDGDVKMMVTRRSLNLSNSSTK